MAKIIYSDKAVIAPYKDITGFQFRIANKRADHQMVDTEVDVLLSRIENDTVKFYNLELEYKKISLFTATWTVNHPIDEISPLFGQTEEDLKSTDSEFIVLIKGFDDTFAQIVHSRSSYKYSEIIWGAKFANVYGKSESGRTTIELDKISDIYSVPLVKTELQ